MEVAGRLSTADDTPIPLARVSLFGGEEGGRDVVLVQHTAGDGSFVFPDVAAGEYTLTVHRAGTIAYDGRVVDAISLDLRRSATGPYLPLQGELLVVEEVPHFAITSELATAVPSRRPARSLDGSRLRMARR